MVSGVGGDTAAFDKKIKQLDIDDIVINTGFVSDEERDCLYENCRLFLFPSIFEGFGMPPVEAMRKGKRVVMTTESCLYEVTDGKAIYVKKPFDTGEWMAQIEYAETLPKQKVAFDQYSLKAITDNFTQLFKKASL